MSALHPDSLRILSFQYRHLKGNVTALDIHLSPAQVSAIDGALPFDYGQPQSEVRNVLSQAVCTNAEALCIVWNGPTKTWLSTAGFACLSWDDRLRTIPPADRHVSSQRE